MLEFRYDTQLLIEGKGLDEDAIAAYFQEHFQGDCLLAVGDEEVVKIHFHTKRTMESAGILRLARQHLRYCDRGHGTAGAGSAGLNAARRCGCYKFFICRTVDKRHLQLHII